MSMAARNSSSRPFSRPIAIRTFVSDLRRAREVVLASFGTKTDDVDDQIVDRANRAFLPAKLSLETVEDRCDEIVRKARDDLGTDRLDAAVVYEQPVKRQKRGRKSSSKTRTRSSKANRLKNEDLMVFASKMPVGLFHDVEKRVTQRLSTFDVFRRTCEKRSSARSRFSFETYDTKAMREVETSVVASGVDGRVPDDVALLRVAIFRNASSHGRGQHGPDQVFEALSCNLLTDLLDHPSFHCPQDAVATSEPPRYLFLNDTFYTENPAACAADLAWIHQLGTPSEIRVRALSGVRFEDLTIRLGARYVYKHQYGCEHVLVFTDIREMDEHARRTTPLNRFPMHVRQRKISRRTCDCCMRCFASNVVYDDTLCPSTPSFLCDRCCSLLHSTSIDTDREGSGGHSIDEGTTEKSSTTNRRTSSSDHETPITGSSSSTISSTTPPPPPPLPKIVPYVHD